MRDHVKVTYVEALEVSVERTPTKQQIPRKAKSRQH